MRRPPPTPPTPRAARRRTRPVRLAVVLLLGLLMALTTAPAGSATTTDTAPDTATAPADVRTAALPSSFQWSSSGQLISPKPDGSHNIVAVKDPTVVQHDGRWHVYMTTANTAGQWSLAHTSFTDWSQAAAAPHTYLDANPDIGNRYAAAPQVFYFAPRDEWYLVYQTGLPSFSVNSDPGDPAGWSAPRNFQSSMPDIIRDNIGDGHWVDFWVICDDTMCYLYSSDDNGQLYRAETTIGEFPDGFRNTRIELQDANRYALFEGSAIYRVQDTDTYLLIIEAIGSDGRRYYRSFTSQGLGGQWQPLAASEANPFARANNTAFPGGAWTQDISHGELIRSGSDQTMTIDPCRLQLLYQGQDPGAGGDYSQLPWRLGLLTQTNPTC
ncbi:non-reducing end alpha-L-arabinofuranosidase family hydrolase [Streptomyces carpaticus]|uniref:non-reducing end alpha-L-arabinofuranosidase family hydrolase n=1 Tax=Streptomyces carpaticus TaxID=285558 RepID=UPI0022014903|nr:non-reducing end alpha-L-arabinofuranosidase family hydrolase [Streptomyces carpaticus]